MVKRAETWVDRTTRPSQHRDAHRSIDLNPVARGRKRGRDECASLDGGQDVVVGPLPLQAEPVDSQSTTLIQPNGFLVEAGSQTGTWAEEGASTTANYNDGDHHHHMANRPIMPRRKVQRLHTSSAIATLKSENDDPSSPSSPINMDTMTPTTTPQSSHPTKSQPVDPTVDDFTLHLGIGWTRLADDGDRQAAARGWARYIEKHFPTISHAQILLQSKSLDDAFLVGADQGFFLFDEDMAQGRLVGRTEQVALRNLKSVPVVFEGETVLRPGGGGGGHVVEHVTTNDEMTMMEMATVIPKEEEQQTNITTDMMTNDAGGGSGGEQGIHSMDLD